MLVTFPLLLLLFSGSHALVPSVDWFIKGSSDASEDRSDDLAWEDADEYTVETVRGVLHGTVGSKMRQDTRKSFVQHPKDGEELDLVMNFLGDGPYDKTGQLKFDSVPKIVSSLIDAILDVMYSREEYIRILSYAERPVMAEVVKEMLRKPTQPVLQQQLFHKIIAERYWKHKVIDPLMQDNKRDTLLMFGRHLLDAKRNSTLTTEDTTDFDAHLENIAFFDRKDDAEFQAVVDDLIESFGTSVGQTQDNESIARSAAAETTEQVAKKLNIHHHGLVNPKFRRSEFRSNSRYETTTESPMITTTPPMITTEPPMITTTLPMITTKPPMITTKARITTTLNVEDTKTPRYVPTSGYRTTGDYGRTMDIGPTTPGYVPTSGFRTTGDYGSTPDIGPTTPGYVPTSGFRTTGDYGSTPDIGPTTPGYVPTSGFRTTGDYGSTPDIGPTTPGYVPTSGFRTTGDYRRTTEAEYATTGSPEDTTTPRNVPTSEYRTTGDNGRTTEAEYATTGTPKETTTPRYVPTSGYRTTGATGYPLTSNAQYETTTDSYGTSGNQDYTTTPDYRRTTSRVTKQRKPLKDSLPYSNKSDRSELKNSSGIVSSIVKDDADENPIVYVQGLNDDDGDDSFDSGIEKNSIKKMENKDFISLASGTPKVSSTMTSSASTQKASPKTSSMKNNASKTSTAKPYYGRMPYHYYKD